MFWSCSGGGGGGGGTPGGWKSCGLAQVRGNQFKSARLRSGQVVAQVRSGRGLGRGKLAQVTSTHGSGQLKSRVRSTQVKGQVKSTHGSRHLSSSHLTSVTRLNPPKPEPEHVISKPRAQKKLTAQVISYAPCEYAHSSQHSRVGFGGWRVLWVGLAQVGSG